VALVLIASGTPVAARLPTPCADRWDIALEKAFGSVVSGAFESADGVVADPVLHHWLDVVGTTVATKTDGALIPRFVLVDSAVINAWSVPGGTVVVTRGLLESVDSDDALATVLAHECGHVSRRHAWKQIYENIGVLALLGQLRSVGSDFGKFGMVANVVRALGRSRSMESEADRVGFGISRSAGWDPRAFLSFVGDGGPTGPVWLSSHPSGRTRQESIVRLLDQETIPGGIPARPPGLSRWKPLPPLPIAPDPQGRRARLAGVGSAVRSRLRGAGLESELGGVLQQSLLLTTDVTNPTHLVLSSRAWMVQQKLNDSAAGLSRIVAVAPAVWDRLEAATPVEAAVGRGELELAMDRSGSVFERLSAARRATALVLANVNLRGLPSRRFSGMAAEIAVQEGLLRLAEAALAEANREIDRSWTLISQARIRAYSARVGTLAGTNRVRIAWLAAGLQRRSGAIVGTVDSADGLVRSALAASLGLAAREVAGLPGFPDTASAAGRAGVAPTVALLLRLMVLDAEREWE
jgi:hypothetical protein